MGCILEWLVLVEEFTKERKGKKRFVRTSSQEQEQPCPLFASKSLCMCVCVMTWDRLVPLGCSLARTDVPCPLLGIEEPLQEQEAEERQKRREIVNYDRSALQCNGIMALMILHYYI